MRELILYSTADCHLCDQALQLLQNNPTIRTGSVQLRVVDIADDDALIDRYGVRIPVVRAADDELGWPFDAAALTAFLRAAFAAAR